MLKPKEKMTVAEQIHLAIKEKLEENTDVICFGLGTTDPKGIIGTTIDLHKEFGEERVFDTPTSENAMTGIGVGAAITGKKVIMIHQRLDFFLLALDQLINNAAKIYYMYGNVLKANITIRLIIGRGWGQGPTHSQNLQSWFANTPGLKVLMPCFAKDNYNLLKEAIDDDNPVVYLEHRWLHNLKDIGYEKVLSGDIKIGQSRLCITGTDITIVTMGYTTIEGIKATEYLEIVA